MSGALLGAVSQGILWGIMVLGVYITYKLLDIADLTVDGSFALGGSVCAVCIAGAIRYNALRSKLDGVSNTVLSSALRELERDGLVTRQEYLEVPVRVEYSPTDSCRELLPILEQLSDWAEKRM